jgi:hypothetical protein
VLAALHCIATSTKPGSVVVWFGLVWCGQGLYFGTRSTLACGAGAGAGAALRDSALGTKSTELAKCKA